MGESYLMSNSYAIGYIFGIILSFFIISAILMWLWNGLMPFLFGLSTLNYIQAMALYMVSNILFGDHRMPKMENK